MENKKDFPRRRTEFKRLWAEGLVPDGLTGTQIVERMHKADPDAPKVKGPQSYFNWKAAGFPGLDLDAPLDETETE